ncbi:MAG: CHAT domain-containing protein [Acidimicrobiales bacterium]
MGVLLRLRPSPPADVGEALRLAPTEPQRARRMVEAVLGSRTAPADVGVMVDAERALGLAARALSDLQGAAAHLERAVALATGAGLAVPAAEARRNLVWALLSAGRTDDALAQIDLAVPVLQGRAAAQLVAQRANILLRLGRHDEALRGYRRALAGFRRGGDIESEAKVLMSRGVLHTYCGRFQAAEADLRGAEVRHVRLGQALSAAEVRQGLGFLEARRGDVAAALRWYDQADREYAALDVVRPDLVLDRAEALLSVHLIDQARQAGNRAAQEFGARGMEAELADARLLLSQAALLAGDATEAIRMGTAARAAFVAQLRPGWAALAGYAVVRATVGLMAPGPATVAAARLAVDELDAAGWVGPAMDARLIVARLALDAGRLSDAEAALAVVSRSRARGPAELRARAWQATALWRRAKGDLPGADRALRAGCRALALHQTTLGATELRVQVGCQAAELGEMGLELALDSGRPERVLAWAERGRAGALRTRAARPPANADLAGQLSELRQVVSGLEQAGFEGGDGAPLRRRRVLLEAKIQRTAWLASPDGASPQAEPPTVEALTAALGERALVEFVAHGGQLHAVVVAGGRAHLTALGPVAGAQAEVDALRFALSRLARGRGSGSSRQAASASLHFSARALDDQLLRPVCRWIGDRPLVLVPTGPLHALPWSTLPSAWDRDVSLSPSAALWFRAARAALGQQVGATVLVAGPGLAHAPAEIAQLARAYPGATTLVGDQATAGQVVGALDGAALVHVAAHGRFRADNPLFSSLRLVDGPLTVYDLEGLGRAPSHLVLSACDVGLSSVSPGDELMGLTAALVAMGTQSLVASVVPVPDDVTRALMVDFHRRLATGSGPAAALAAAQGAARADDDRTLALTAGFVCFGAA